MPHRNGAAVLHATDIKFDQSPGAMNVFCTSDATDLQRSYPVDFQQTANITTFMQKDIINADLGYMVNGGFSDLMKNWTVEDDQFVVLVEVQLQDTDNTADGDTHDVQLSVRIGNVFVVGKKLLINYVCFVDKMISFPPAAKETVTVVRPDTDYDGVRDEELGDIIIEVRQSKNGTYFDNSTEHIFEEG